MKNKVEPTYSLTPKGFFHIYLGEKTEVFLDNFELFLRRNDYNAVIFNGKDFIFTKVYLED